MKSITQVLAVAAVGAAMLAAMLASLGLCFMILKWLNESNWPEEIVAVGQLGAIAVGIGAAAVCCKVIIEGIQRRTGARK